MRAQLLRYAPWIVVGAAFIARLGYVLQSDANPLFAYPVVDAKTYVDLARAYAAGDWLGPGASPYWQAPLYPWMLGLVLGVSGDAFFHAVRVLQAAIGAATCLLAFDVGRRAFRLEVGLVAGLIAALYGPLIFFDAELLPAGLATCLNLWGLHLLLRASEDPRPVRFLQAGAVFGLAALTVATVLTFVPVAALWAGWTTRGEARAWPDGMRRAAVFVAGAALVVAPVTVRNAAIGGDVVLISWNGGVNYYLGNNAEYEATVGVRPGWEWTDLVTEPDRAGITRPSEKSRYFFGKARAYLTSEPLGWAALQARKTAEFWRGREVGRNQPVYYWRAYSPLLAGTMWVWGIAFPFGILAPLAVLGMAVSARRREARLPLLFVVVYAASVVAFFPSARYRLPVVPVLAVFGAWAAFWLVAKLRAGDRVRAAAGAVGVVVLAVALNWGTAPMDMAGNADVHYNLGDAYVRAGRLQQAQDAFVRVLELEPGYDEARFTIGTIRGMMGDATGAVRILADVAQREPDRAEVWLNLAGAYLGLDRPDDARTALERSLAVDRRNQDAYVQLLALLVREGDVDGARDLIERVREHLPEDAGRFEDLFAQLLARREG